jgi:7,8-didemethyl-8-hydroxy-5-deazariboflavin synthase CofH subunit
MLGNNQSSKATEFRETLSSTSLRTALAACSPSMCNVLQRSLDCAPPNFDEALLLAQARGSDLVALLKTADELRLRANGDLITYVVNRNLNFTNVCYVGCSFCGFGVGAHAPGAYFHSHATLIQKVREAAEAGATEICIQGGLPKDLDGFYYRDLLVALKSAFPRIHCHAFSPMEIANGVEKTGMQVREYLQMLKGAGLGSIPGTAAEILDDRVREQLSPNKLKVRQWVEIISTAHELGIPTTSTMMYGHVETAADWVRHLMLLRDMQFRTGGFTEFVPLGFIHTNTRLFQLGEARPGPSLEEHLRVHALARVLLDGAINNIQVSWVKLGAELSLACLQSGANDFGGTLMEESISKAAGADHGEYVAPQEFHELIRSMGRIPAERSTTYKLLRVFEQTLSERRSARTPDRVPHEPIALSRAGASD